MMRRELELVEKLRIAVGRIARRSDVRINAWAGGWTVPVGRWKAVLPADMFAAYQAYNGLVFRFEFTNGPPHGQYGVDWLSLDRNGSETIDPVIKGAVGRRAPASKYPDYFFQPKQLSPTDPVLFFFGSDDAYGYVLVGEKKSARFFSWNNDGFVQTIKQKTFTEFLEQWMACGFAGLDPKHPDVSAAIAKLATTVARRKTFKVTVKKKQEIDVAEYRKSVCKKRKVDIASVAKALTGKVPAAPKQAWADVNAMCASAGALDERRAKAAAKALGFKAKAVSKTKFVETFVVGCEAVASLELEVKPYPHELTADWFEEHTLLRVLDSLPGARMAEDYPVPRELLQYAQSEETRYWSPFLEYKDSGSDKQKRFTLLVPSWRAENLVSGKSYDSTALPDVAPHLSPRRTQKP